MTDSPPTLSARPPIMSDETYEAQQDPYPFNSNLWQCALAPPTATPTPIPPTATHTPIPPTATHTATPDPLCINVGPGAYWKFPVSKFLSGTITVYSSSSCADPGANQISIGDLGYVYVDDGQSANARCGGPLIMTAGPTKLSSNPSTQISGNAR